MQEIMKKLVSLDEEFRQVYNKLEIDTKISRVSELEKEVAKPEIWNDVKKATEMNQELSKLTEETQPFELLRTQIKDLGELIQIADDDLKEEINGQIVAMRTQFEGLKKSPALKDYISAHHTTPAAGLCSSYHINHQTIKSATDIPKTISEHLSSDTQRPLVLELHTAAENDSALR